MVKRLVLPLLAPNYPICWRGNTFYYIRRVNQRLLVRTSTLPTVGWDFILRPLLHMTLAVGWMLNTNKLTNFVCAHRGWRGRGNPIALNHTYMLPCNICLRGDQNYVEKWYAMWVKRPSRDQIRRSGPSRPHLGKHYYIFCLIFSCLAFHCGRIKIEVYTYWNSSRKQQTLIGIITEWPNLN